MFSDENMFKCIRSASTKVRRLLDSNRFDPRFTVKTVKHPAQVMVWGCFTGAKGRGGLYFLPKGQMMNGDNYKLVLEEHLLPFMACTRPPTSSTMGPRATRPRRSLPCWRTASLKSLTGLGTVPIYSLRKKYKSRNKYKS